MNGQAIKYLAGVAELARLDLEAAAVTIRSTKIDGAGYVSATYAGMYARGVRAAEGDGQEFELSINANQFKTLAGMFSDEDNVTLTPSNKGLRIRARSADVLFNGWGEITPDELTAEARAYDLALAMPTDVLLSEIDAASEFVSVSHMRPALTGIRLTFNKGLKIEASDGNAVFYKSTNDAVKTMGSGSVIIPTADFLLGARLVTGGNARLYKPKGEDAIVIYNSRSVFRSVLIKSPWPELREMMKETPAKASFKVESAQLRNLVGGARSLGSGPDVEVSSNKGRITFKTESEMGAFSTSVKGDIEGPLKYGTESMAKIIKLGPVLDFYVPARPEQPTIVSSGHRKCWVLTRV